MEAGLPLRKASRAWLAFVAVLGLIPLAAAEVPPIKPNAAEAPPAAGPSLGQAFSESTPFTLSPSPGQVLPLGTSELSPQAPPSAGPVAQSNPESVDLNHLTELAKTGEPKAQVDLAVACLKSGTAEDYRRAFALFESAATRGFPAAEYFLYWSYHEGIGTARNDQLALNWCKKAAGHGCPPAQADLGDAYFRGLMGLAINQSKARGWYRRAAIQGVASSRLALVDCYYNGLGGPIERDKAFYWAVQAAEAGDARGALDAAVLYREEAGGLKPNVDLAWIWSTIADRKGLPSDELRNQSANLRKELEGVMTAEQRAKDDERAIRYRVADAVLRPDLIDRTKISIDSAEFNKFETLGSCIALPVYINGQGPFRFILDTGATASVIDPRLSGSLHLSSLGVFPDFAKVEKSANLVEADYAVFGIRVHRGVFVEMRLGEISQTIGKRIDGILGADFIQGAVLEIDYEAQTIGFFEAETYAHDASLGAEIPLEFWGKWPVMQVTLGGLHHEQITLPMAIDTGNGGAINLNEAFDREYSFAKLVPKAIPTNSTTAQGVMPGAEGRLQYVGFGGYEIPEPVVTCDRLVEVTIPAGSIGGDILRRFKVILDYKHKRMFLEPNANLKKGLQAEWTGFAAFPGETGFKSASDPQGVCAFSSQQGGPPRGGRPHEMAGHDRDRNVAVYGPADEILRLFLVSTG